MTTGPLHAPLEPGRFLLVEASAGTGKTWLTEALVLRLVAEAGIPVERILVITFTNAATAELRARVRERLALARALLAGDTRPATDDDAILRLWDERACTRDEARGRVAAALRDFDQAPISTIHGFCQRMLTRFPHLLDVDPGLAVGADVGEVLGELVADEMTAQWSRVDAATARTLRAEGWTEKWLGKVARAMAGAVAPEFRGPAPGGPDAAACVAALATWREARADAVRTLTAGAAYVERLGEHATNSATLKGCKSNFRLAEKVWRWAKGPAHDVSSPFDAAYMRNLVPADLAVNWRAKVSPAASGLDPAVGAEIGRALTRCDDLVAPTAAAATRLASLLVADFAAGVRARAEDTLRRRGQLTYDALLSLLAERIVAGGGAESPAAQAVRGLYDAALVDEFQDTDLAQWTALGAVFRHAGCRLVAVGDPKQAIYAFRGADLDVYLAARTVATTMPLGANRRSDEGLVRALNRLWEGQKDTGSGGMGEGVGYVEVGWTKADRLVRVGDGPRLSPVELHTFDGDGGIGAKWPAKDLAQGRLARACAARVHDLLADPTLRVRIGEDVRGLVPRDVAVIVRTHEQAALVRAALADAGRPSISSGGRARVEASPAAEWVLRWLDALADVERDEATRRWALTPLVGWSPARLGRAVATIDAPETDAGDSGDVRAYDALREALRADADRWRDGFWVALERALRRHDALARVLAGPGGERDATDLRQVMGLLHAEERVTRASPGALAAWLRARRATPSQSEEADSSLELETDRSAVRILTNHASKGLQFPVVMLPFAWEEPQFDPDGAPLVVSESVIGGLPRRALFLGPEGQADRDAAADLAGRRAQEERLRLLYVAMTRPEHLLVAWLGRSAKGGASSLRLLGLPDNATPSAVRAAIDDLDRAFPSIPTLAADAARDAAPPPDAPLGPRPHLSWPSAFGHRFQRTSYTALAAGKAHDADGLDGALPADLVADDELARPAPMHRVHAGGTGLGKLVHALLEHVDFPTGAPRGDHPGSAGVTDVGALVARLGQREGFVDAEVGRHLVALLPGWLDTPLHLDEAHPRAAWSPRPGFTLRALQAGRRLDELAFDLSLGGEDRVSPARVNALVDALLAGPPPEGTSDDALRWLAAVRAAQREKDAEDGVTEPDAARSLTGRLRGILNGSIDLLFHDGRRYWICDYKTNAVRGPPALRDAVERLAERQPVTSGDARQRNLHFSAPLLAWEMAHAAYHLQALVYTVATHRLLGQRLPGYRDGGAAAYDEHVGGHVYLFLRGMGGPRTPRHGGAPLGVWVDRWPWALIDGLDRALRGGPAPERP